MIQLFAAGEIVPGLQVLDAVSNATVECGQTYTGYYIGKEPAMIFDGSLPFGLTPRQHNAWLLFGDGRKLMDEVYDSFGVVGLPCGQTGGQMFGWFRKELKTTADFKGLKMRTAGFGGRVMAKLGVVPQQIAGGDIYPALEKGTIDACEWVGPYDDEKLGFHKVAKYYYTPGVMELEAVNQLFIHKAAWAALPPAYQAALRYACWYAATEMVASYDAKNAQAINRVIAGGAQLSVLPPEIIKALRTALETVLDEEAAKSSGSRRSSTIGASSAPSSTAGSPSPIRAPRLPFTARRARHGPQDRRGPLSATLQWGEGDRPPSPREGRGEGEARTQEDAAMAVAMSKAPAATAGKRAQMLIDGSWVDSASGKEISVEFPGNRQVIASIPRGDAEDVDRAVKAASKAFASWSRVVPRERGRMLQKIADAVEARVEELARIVAEETGNAIRTQAPARGQGCGRHLALLRRPRQRAQRRDDPARRARAELHAARADRRGRRHHSLECAGHARRAQDRTRALRRQHAGAEGRRGRSAGRAVARRDLPGASAATACSTS